MEFNSGFKGLTLKFSANTPNWTVL